MTSLKVLAGYIVLTIVLTFPLAFRLRTIEAGDAAYFAWVMAWEIHAIRSDPAALPHANQYHPMRYALATDETLLGTTALILPISWLTNDAILLANLARLLTFALTAMATYFLARELECGLWPSVLAGALFAFSPIRTDQINHLSTLGTQWWPLALLFAIRATRSSAKLWAALLAGLFFALGVYACTYHGLLACLIWPCAWLPLLWRRARVWPLAFAAVLTSAVLIAPLYLWFRTAQAEAPIARTHAETALLSASIETFVAAHDWNFLYGRITERFRGAANDLFPGLVPPLLALCGLVIAWRRKQSVSREALVLVLMAGLAAGVALGPEVRICGRTLCVSPLAYLRENIAALAVIRVMSRAGIFIALPLALLAAKGLAALRLRPRVVAITGALALAETLIVPIPIDAWAQVKSASPVYDWLAAQQGDFALVELPMLTRGAGLGHKPAYHASAYLLHSTRHWQRLVNGYGGAQPAGYVALSELSPRFPHGAFLDELRKRGVRYVVFHGKGHGPNQRERMLALAREAQSGLREVARWTDDEIVFELLPTTGTGTQSTEIMSQ
ncbi:MAG: hypothetical protein MUF51_04635 [Vicinamibacteria bacterium]|jgi:hypothetical protein|nr:hypothetical protein [Vicinamibacteria bacterium]